MTTQRAGQNPLLDFCTGLLSFFEGMRVTATNLITRPKITVQYPFERLKVSPRYRGLFYLPYDAEAKRLKCTGCTLCQQACPTKVISMVKLGAGKNGSVEAFTMDLGRCMFCKLCVEACPFEAIYMGPQYELASVDRNASVFHIADLAVGGEPAVMESLQTLKAALAEEAAAKAAKAVKALDGSEKPAAHRPAAAVKEAAL